MANPTVVGYRFRPTDVELVDNYLQPKNDESSDGGDTTNHVDRVFNTLNISSFDPWELCDQSIMKSEDQVWYFFGRKENKYNRGDRQMRKTKSGFWKKTGKPTEIKRKNGEKIGEKCVLVFHWTCKLKTEWIMHEYHLFSPDQITRTYTVCKVKFKGKASEISSHRGDIEQIHSSITQMNNSGGLSIGSEVGTLFECPQSQEVENQQQLSGPLMMMMMIRYLQQHFGSSNHRIDQITNLQESPNSTIKLSQKVNQTPSQETKILGQEKTKDKRAGFFYSIMQMFIKKIQLCTSI
ncbi:hypothetical protein AALP_AA1G005700 [Arabis alpina]|uniref:NAC domain-containing protein n=1 Tax=Arabis alpina TaxID=50452 RepID=A0A087HK73_ARAAL|nr:hypothetical protein AALP_AA1G005700 [Arabis alpina]